MDFTEVTNQALLKDDLLDINLDTLRDQLLKRKSGQGKSHQLTAEDIRKEKVLDIPEGGRSRERSHGRLRGRSPGRSWAEDQRATR